MSHLLSDPAFKLYCEFKNVKRLPTTMSNSKIDELINDYL